jgi:hypothetical protein
MHTTSDVPLVVPERAKTMMIIIGAVGIVGVSIILASTMSMTRYTSRINILEDEINAYQTARSEMQKRKKLYTDKLEQLELKKGFYCDKCKGTSSTSHVCENPSCPNQPDA